MREVVGTLIRPVRAGQRRSRLTLISAPNVITVTSCAFENGEAMPPVHAGKGLGDNVSPALRWSGVPHDTNALVLIVEDVDVPLPRPLWHTVAMLHGDIDHLDTGALHPHNPEIRFFKTFLGRGYSGPRPISGHGAHRYCFHLFALNAAPTVRARRADLLRDIREKVVGRGLLIGTYQR